MLRLRKSVSITSIDLALKLIDTNFLLKDKEVYKMAFYLFAVGQDGEEDEKIGRYEDMLGARMSAQFLSDEPLQPFIGKDGSTYLIATDEDLSILGMLKGAKQINISDKVRFHIIEQ